jgi:hypothetical protein
MKCPLWQFVIATSHCSLPNSWLPIEIVQFITTALKSARMLVKLRSLGAKCCKMWKFGEFCLLKQNLQTTQGYFFRILQHFATKLCSFTNAVWIIYYRFFIYKNLSKFYLLYNQSNNGFTSGKFPDEWKLTEVIIKIVIKRYHLVIDRGLMLSGRVYCTALYRWVTLPRVEISSPAYACNLLRPWTAHFTRSVGLRLTPCLPPLLKKKLNL